MNKSSEKLLEFMRNNPTAYIEETISKIYNDPKGFGSIDNTFKRS